MSIIPTNKSERRLQPFHHHDKKTLPPHISLFLYTIHSSPQVERDTISHNKSTHLNFTKWMWYRLS